MLIIMLVTKTHTARVHEEANERWEYVSVYGT
jgi:hypothetical protein